MKKTYYLCPVEGFISENDDYCFIYECVSFDDRVEVKVTNLHYLTEKPYSFDVVFTPETAMSLLVKGLKHGYDVLDINEENIFNELKTLNPDLIETMIFFNGIN